MIEATVDVDVAPGEDAIQKAIEEAVSDPDVIQKIRDQVADAQSQFLENGHAMLVTDDGVLVEVSTEVDDT